MTANGKRTILLIEDDSSSARLEKSIFEKNGYIVVVSSSGEDAVEIVKRGDDIDILVTDITLGGEMDGIETVDMVHKMRYLPAVFLSVHTEPEIIERTERVNSYGYVVKSSGSAVLLAAIKMAFRLFDANISINNQKNEIEAANEEMQAAMEEMEAINQELIDTQRSLVESESKLRAVIDQSPLPMMLLTRAGRLTVVNDTWVKMWGVSKEDAVKYYKLEKDTQVNTRLLEHINRAFNGETVDLPVLQYFSGVDGRKKPIWVGGKVYPLKEGDGAIESVVLVSEDITDKVIAENAIKASEEKFRNIFRDLTIGYFRTGIDGGLLDINPACLKIFGYDSEDDARQALGNSSTGVYAEESDWSMVRERLISGENPFIGTVKFKKKNGAEFMAGLNIRIIYSADGEPDHIEGLIEDVTERHKTQEMLIQSEKMITVAGLAAGMAHEINNPLGIIMQNAENSVHRLLDDLPGNIKAAGEAGVDVTGLRAYVKARRIDVYLSSILEAGERASKIVWNMLQFSRGSESRFSSLNINNLLDKAIDLISNEYDIRRNYDFRNIRITRRYGEIPDIQCTETSIEQVFLNIFKNAAQAMNSGEKVPGRINEITIATALVGESIRIEIGDNGPGIDRATQGRIFEPFFSTKETGLGAGLGLSVSYYIIVDGHGGTISVNSVPGSGTVFTITLPVRRGDN